MPESPEVFNQRFPRYVPVDIYLINWGRVY